jgi:hypothetical protein
VSAGYRWGDVELAAACTVQQSGGWSCLAHAGVRVWSSVPGCEVVGPVWRMQVFESGPPCQGVCVCERVGMCLGRVNGGWGWGQQMVSDSLNHGLANVIHTQVLSDVTPPPPYPLTLPAGNCDGHHFRWYRPLRCLLVPLWLWWLQAHPHSYSARLVHTYCLTECHTYVLQVTVTVNIPDGTDASGVFLSLSGSGGFKHNTRLGPDRTSTFQGLQPGMFYLKPLLREHSFDPPVADIQLEDGQQMQLELTAVRAAWGVSGAVKSGRSPVQILLATCTCCFGQQMQLELTAVRAAWGVSGAVKSGRSPVQLLLVARLRGRQYQAHASCRKQVH